LIKLGIDTGMSKSHQDDSATPSPSLASLQAKKAHPQRMEGCVGDPREEFRMAVEPLTSG